MLNWDEDICLTNEENRIFNSKFGLLLSHLAINIPPDFAYMVYFREIREIIENLRFLIF